MTKILLREIIKCNDEQKRAILEIRNKKSVRQFMYTDHEISPKEHAEWVENLKSDNQQIVFVVFVDKLVCGSVSVNAIDRIHLKSNWSLYLDEKIRGGVVAAIEFSFINFVFRKLGLEKLNCEVIQTNENVVKLHKKFGFLEEGFKRENIIKNKKRIGVFFLGLTKSDWKKSEKNVKKLYGKIINKFNLEIEYERY